VRRALELVTLVALLLANRPALAQSGDEGSAAEPVVAQPAQGQPVSEPGRAVTEVFASRRYAFCHSPEYPLTPAEKRWCELGANASSACPALTETCKHEAVAKQIETDSEPIRIHLPQLPLPLRYLLWLLLAVGLAILLFALVRHFLDHKPKAVITTATPAAAEEDRAAALARQVETDVQRLLERARQEAASGDFRAAIGSVYAALLRRLEGTGLIRVEPDQTNGDYLGKVKRQQPAFAGRMAEVVDGVERAQFSETSVTRDHFDGVWLRVTSLLAERIGLLLVLLGLLFGPACGPPRADWEHSPSGRAGVIAFLGKRGFTVRERLVSVRKIGEESAGRQLESREDDEHVVRPGDVEHALGGSTQLVLLPGARLGDDDWKALKAWVDRGNRSLVIAGGKRPLPDWIGMRVVEKQEPRFESITPVGASAKAWGPLQVRVPEANIVEGPPQSHPVLRRKQSVYASELWLGETMAEEALISEEDEELTSDPDDVSRVVVLADDSLFRNASLLVADNAAALDALLRAGGMSVELIGDLTGLVSSNPIQSVQRGRLGPALLQLLAFLALFFVCKGARFGRPLVTQRLERREFVEHVRALGLHYARARAERVALGSLGAYAIERLRERFGLHVDKSLSGLAEAVAARTGRPVGDLMRMFLEVRDAGKGVPADKDARDMDTAWHMCRLLEETGGTGGHKRIQSHV